MGLKRLEPIAACILLYYMGKGINQRKFVKNYENCRCNDYNPHSQNQMNSLLLFKQYNHPQNQPKVNVGEMSDKHVECYVVDGHDRISD